jgi:hypothetical protein
LSKSSGVFSSSGEDVSIGVDASLLLAFVDVGALRQADGVRAGQRYQLSIGEILFAECRDERVEI